MSTQHDFTAISRLDGTRLAATLFEPEGEALALVQIVHGMAEHRRRYEKVGLGLAQAGYLVVIHDLRGHGESALDEKRLGWFAERDGWSRAVEDIKDVADAVLREHEGLKRVLFGHSMGTLLSRCYIQKHDSELAALVLSGAPCPNKAAGAGKTLAAAIGALRGEYHRSVIMDNMLFGAFNKRIDAPLTDFDWLSYNSENVQRYIEDPLCGYKFTAAGYRDMLDGVERMQDGAAYKCANPGLPILFIAGESDPCTGGTAGLESSIALLAGAGYKDVKKIIYPNMRHEILNEFEWENVLVDVEGWLAQHNL